MVGKHDIHEHEHSWREYRLMILDKLESLASNQDDHRRETQKAMIQINEKLSKIETDLATQKVKVGILGSIAGAVTGIITALITWMKTNP